jgi:hypothetical protein
MGARELIQNCGTLLIAGIVIVSAAGCGRQSLPGDSANSGPAARIVRVAQSGTADVIGTDNLALQKAADMLRPGDVLEIGPGTYLMNNSLFVPSRVTVRGTPGQTILKKGPGVESRLAEDGDYGESQLTVAEPEKFRPGMGLSVMDDTSSSGWDVSVTTITAVDDTQRL